MDKTVTIDENLIELVKSITNRCVIFELIKNESIAPTVVATLLEDMAQDMHSVLEYCIVRE